ncbi:MAG: TolC family protein, partial [Myxococcota bacterium]
STLYPSVSGSFNYTRYNQEVTFDFPDLESTFVENEFRLRSLEQAAQGGPYIPPPEIEEGPPGAPQVVRPLNDYNIALTFSYRVNPRAWPLLKQAYVNRELSELQVDAIREELEFAVTQTYYSMLQLKQALRLRGEQLAADQTALEANQRRFEAGVLRKFELTRSQLRVAQSEQLLAQVRLSFVQTRLALAMLLQTEPDFDVSEEEPVKTLQSVEAYAKGALARRATLSAARKGEELGDWAIEDVKYQYLPTMGVNFTTFRPRATAFAPGEFQWSLGVNLNWTIWDGGLREADMDEKEAQLVRTKLQRRQAEAQLTADLESAWTQYETSLTQLTIARDQRKLAAEAVDETARAFALGAATQLDVLTAEDQLRLAELAMLQEELNVELSVQRLRYLSGRTE